MSKEDYSECTRRTYDLDPYNAPRHVSRFRQPFDPQDLIGAKPSVRKNTQRVGMKFHRFLDCSFVPTGCGMGGYAANCASGAIESNSVGACSIRCPAQP
ncbi:hypothetical protein BN2476_960131 [Paraburkholderia piptadeniae]|uniref:Uncharacterized protein n=1 Tax=Paraburkholderia piptadeniae TaxID=1701573 RepID=A0A1N7SUC1_9BURK|nr:hypothetical protein BN2476_960131 [Paraburkholderia piptadeniae]